MEAEALAKLKAAVHFIITVAQGMTLGSIRLSKILFCADRDAYFKTLHPMFADAYVRGPQGPYLKELRTVLDELQHEHAIGIKKISLGNKSFTDYTSLKVPDTALLSSDEQEQLRNITFRICTDYKAHEISEMTHNSVWSMAGHDEHIPLAAQLVAAPARITKKMRRWAQQQASCV